MYLLEIEDDGRFRAIDVNQARIHLTGISLEQLIIRFVDEILPLEVSSALVVWCQQVNPYPATGLAI